MADENIFVTQKNKESLGKEDYTDELALNEEDYKRAERQRKAAKNPGGENAAGAGADELKQRSLYVREYERRMKLTGELMPNRYKNRDGKKMKAVKNALNELNGLMGKTIDYKSRDAFMEQLREVSLKYDELITACNKYIQGHSHALRRGSEGKYRKKLVGQLLELAITERASLTDTTTAEKLFALKLPDVVLGNVVGNRLSVPEEVYTEDLTREGEHLKKASKEGNIDVTYETAKKANTITEEAANTAGTYRVFDFLGLSALSEKTGMVCIKEKNPGKAEPHSLLGVAKYGPYHREGVSPDRTMEEIETAYGECELRYSKEAGKCLSDIRLMTILLGGNIDAKKDIRFVYEAKKLGGKNFIYISGAYMAANAKLFNKKITADTYKEGPGKIEYKNLPKGDTAFIEKLKSMTREDAKFLLGDIMDDAKIDAFMSRVDFLKNAESTDVIEDLRCDKAFPELTGANAAIEGYDRININYVESPEEQEYNVKYERLKSSLGDNPAEAAEKLALMVSVKQTEGYDELIKYEQNQISEDALNTVIRDSINKTTVKKFAEMYSKDAKKLQEEFEKELLAIGEGIPEAFRKQNSGTGEEDLKNRYAAFRLAQNSVGLYHRLKRDKALLDYLKNMVPKKTLSYEKEPIDAYLTEGIREYCEGEQITADEREHSIRKADEILSYLAMTQVAEDSEEEDVIEAVNKTYDRDALAVLGDNFAGAVDKKKEYDDNIESIKKRKGERIKRAIRDELKKIDDLKNHALFDCGKLEMIKAGLKNALPDFDELKNQFGTKKLNMNFLRDIRNKLLKLGINSLQKKPSDAEDKKLSEDIKAELLELKSIPGDYGALLELLYRTHEYVKALEKKAKEEFALLQAEYERIEEKYGNPDNLLKEELGDKLAENKEILNTLDINEELSDKKKTYAAGVIEIKKARDKEINDKFIIYFKRNVKPVFLPVQNAIFIKYYHFFEDLKNGTKTMDDEPELKKEIEENKKLYNEICDKVIKGEYLLENDTDPDSISEKKELINSPLFKNLVNTTINQIRTNDNKLMEVYEKRLEHEHFVADGKEEKYKKRLFNLDNVEFAKEDTSLPIFNKMLLFKLTGERVSRKYIEIANIMLEDAKKEIKDNDKDGITELRLEDISRNDFEKLKKTNAIFANRLLTDYKLRHADELNIKRLTPTDITLPMDNGAITAIEEEKEGKATNAILRPVIKWGRNIDEMNRYGNNNEGRKIKVYPDPRRLRLFGRDVQHQGERNHMDFGGTCGPSSGSLIVNQLYGMEITDENNSVDFLANAKMCDRFRHRKMNETGGYTIHKVSKQPILSDIYDSRRCGGTLIGDMVAYFEAHGLEAEMHVSTEPEGSLEELTKRIKAGYQVQLSLASQLFIREDSSDVLIGDKDIIGRMDKVRADAWKKGRAYSSHWINVCGVYYEEGVDENADRPSGFIIRDTGSGITKTMTYEQLKRAYIGDDVFKVLGTDLIYVKPKNLTKEFVDKQKEYEKNEADKRSENPTASLSSKVDDLEKTIKPEREYLDKAIETLNKAIESGDEKLYNEKKTELGWSELTEDRRATEKEIEGFYEYNSDNRERFVGDSSYKKLLDKKNTIKGANTARLYHWKKLQNNLPQNAKPYIEKRRTSDKIEKWADESTKDAKKLIEEAKKYNGDYKEMRKRLGGALGILVTLGEFTKEDFEELERLSPYAAGRIMNEYILKNDTKLENTGNRFLKTFTNRGVITYTNENAGIYQKVGYQRWYNSLNYMYLKKESFLVYPPTTAFDNTQTSDKNLEGYRNTSGITVCTRMINLLTGKRVATVDNSLDFLKKQGLVDIKDAYETDENTGEIVIKDGEKQKLPYPDYEKSGAIGMDGMESLFSSYNLGVKTYQASSGEMTIDGIKKAILDKKAVAVSVPKVLLEKKDGTEGIEDAEYSADTFITVYGVYKEEKATDIQGFIIQKPDDSRHSMVTVEELSDMIFGSKDKAVKGSTIIVSNNHIQ